MTIPTRIRRAPPSAPPAATQPSTPPRPRPVRRAVIPIAVVIEVTPPSTEPVAPRQDGESGPKVDYNLVIKKYADKVDNRASAIRAKCVECSCGVLSEVRNCVVTKCALWPFRNGEDPFRKKRVGFAGKKDVEGDDE